MEEVDKKTLNAGNAEVFPVVAYWNGMALAGITVAGKRYSVGVFIKNTSGQQSSIVGSKMITGKHLHLLQ